MLELTREWYLRPARFANRLPEDRYVLLRYEDLVSRPTEVVPAALEQLGIQTSRELREALAHVQARPRTRRTHDHTLSELGVAEEAAARYYADVMARFGYEA
ncbi:MAG: hypothetical protein ACOC6J_00530 [Spirochaetota bacterium]